jgi:hypothetical protein
MHARFEIGTMGRFLSVDPGGYHIDQPQSWNRYAYVGNNPITYSDPTGSERPWRPSTLPSPEYARQNTAALVAAAKSVGRVLDKALPVTMDIIVIGGMFAKFAETGEGSLAEAEKLEADTGVLIEEAETALKDESTLRYTEPGETFIRYESGDPAFSKISPNGNVAPGTYAAPASDGVVPVLDRAGAYNLPNPEIPRTQVFQLQPAAGTPIFGPRPVVGGTGNEVIFPDGAQCTVTTLGSH